jgi:electron transfer flavoprotein alpha subunit
MTTSTACRRFWVFIKQEEGKIHPVAWELLGVARRLADEVEDELGKTQDQAVVEGILVGYEIAPLAEQAIHYGAWLLKMNFGPPVPSKPPNMF